MKEGPLSLPLKQGPLVDLEPEPTDTRVVCTSSGAPGT